MKNLCKLKTVVKRFVYRASPEGVAPSDKAEEQPTNIVDAAKKFNDLNKNAEKNKGNEVFQKKLKSAKLVLDNFIKESLKKFGCVSDTNNAVKNARDKISSQKNPTVNSIEESIKKISCKVDGKEKVSDKPRTIDFELGEKGKAEGAPVLSSDGKSINGEKIEGIPKGHVLESITVGDDGKISITHKKGTENPKNIKINGKEVGLEKGGIPLIEKKKIDWKKQEGERKLKSLDGEKYNVELPAELILSEEEYKSKKDEINIKIKEVEEKLVYVEGEEINSLNHALGILRVSKKEFEKNYRGVKKSELKKEREALKMAGRKTIEDDIDTEGKKSDYLENALKSKKDGGLGLKKKSKEYKELKEKLDKQVKYSKEKRYKKSKKSLSETGTKKEADEAKAEKVKKINADISDLKKQMDGITDKDSDAYKKLEVKHKTLTDELKKLEEKESLDEKGKEFSDKIDEIVKRQTDLAELLNKKKPSKVDRTKIKELEEKSKKDLVGFGESGLDEKNTPEEWKKEEIPADEKKLLEDKKDQEKALKELREKRKSRGLKMIQGKKPEEILDLIEKNQDTFGDTFLETQKDGTMKVNFHGGDENLIGMGHFEKKLMSKFKYVKVYNPKTGQTVIGVRKSGQGNKPGYFDINTGKYIPIFTGSVITGLSAKDIQTLSVSVKNAMGHPRNNVVSLLTYLKSSKDDRKKYRGKVERNGVRRAAGLTSLAPFDTSNLPKDLRETIDQLNGKDKFPPYSSEAQKLFYVAARADGMDESEANKWAKSSSLHYILSRESAGIVGNLNYTIKRRGIGKQQAFAQIRTTGKTSSLSSATGLGQLLGSNYKKYMGNYNGLGKAVPEAVAMIRYIKDRYGSPEVARSVYGRTGSYTNAETGRRQSKRFREGY